MRKRRGGIIPKDSGKEGWLEEIREEEERTGKTDVAAMSDKEVDGESGRWDRNKYGKTRWEAIEDEKCS